jgi:RsiW-degrading membrane proteinase PrsW (M82 family)
MHGEEGAMIEPATFLGVAVISGAAWFGILLAIDPHRREKGSTKSLLISLAWGFTSVPLVFVLYAFAPDFISGIRTPLGQEFVYEVMVVGPVEEFAKFFIFFLVMVKRKPVQEPLDGMLNAAAVALAFSLLENVLYGFGYGIEILVLRAFVSTPGHLCFACIWGFAYSALIHANLRRRARDYIILFFSIFPAAVLHGLSNFLIELVDSWAYFYDGAQLIAAAALVFWLRRTSPFGAFRLADANLALRRIELSLASNEDNFALNLRAALARAARGDYGHARSHIDKCLGARNADAFASALSGAIHVLQGETARGEEALHASYRSLSPRHKLTLGRLVRHIARSRRTGNAYNEFLLTMWMKEELNARRQA